MQVCSVFHKLGAKAEGIGIVAGQAHIVEYCTQKLEGKAIN
jgi:hypothetical protein